MTSFDAIVVGGGHNGLTAAAVMAKAGRKVLVLEAASETAPGQRLHEFAPGYRVAPLGHVINRIHPEVAKALDLKAHGLNLATPSAPTIVLSPDRRPLVLRGGYGETVEGLGDADTKAWGLLRAQLMRHAAVLKPLLSRRPPVLGEMSLGDKALLGGLGLSLRRLGRDEMRDFLRMVLTNVADVADEHLEDDRLKGLLAFDAVLGSQLGPRSPTSLLGLYYRLAGELEVPGAQILPRGDQVAQAFEGAAQLAGAVVRTGANVVRFVIEQNRAIGVVLADGEVIKAAQILASVSPKTAFLDLVGPKNLGTGMVRKSGAIRAKGNVAKLHLALTRVPDFAGVSGGDLGARFVIAPSIDHVERAFNPAKYGEFSPDPVFEITLPSVVDPDLAPEGGCVLSANVQFAPYALKGGWEIGRPAFMARIMKVLEEHAPGISASVVGAELMTPLDIEARFRMPGGHWHHGELQPDQMLVSRPFHGAAGYDTPIEGLFLASAGSHPGGGISGVPGLNAARHALARRR